MPKNIVVYSDGTGQDGGVRPEQTISNVYKLYHSSRTSPDNPIGPHEQVAFYDPGLGTDIAPPHDLNGVSGFLNLRVVDIRMCYRDWSKKGAQFLSESLDNHGHELRCYMRDPDGYLIEVGQSSQSAIDIFNKFAD